MQRLCTSAHTDFDTSKHNLNNIHMVALGENLRWLKPSRMKGSFTSNAFKGKSCVSAIVPCYPLFSLFHIFYVLLDFILFQFSLFHLTWYLIFFFGCCYHYHQSSQCSLQGLVGWRCRITVNQLSAPRTPSCVQIPKWMYHLYPTCVSYNIPQNRHNWCSFMSTA